MHFPRMYMYVRAVCTYISGVVIYLNLNGRLYICNMTLNSKVISAKFKKFYYMDHLFLPFY